MWKALPQVQRQGNSLFLWFIPTSLLFIMKVTGIKNFIVAIIIKTSSDKVSLEKNRTMLGKLNIVSLEKNRTLLGKLNGTGEFPNP